MNKVAGAFNLQTIEKYMKNSYSVNVSNVDSPRLLQFKSYLKIISISYISEISNLHITSDEIKSIIKVNHIFNNIVLVSKPRIIKVLLKLDIFIIWINIWDVQSGIKAKGLINRYFNVRRYIITIWGTNMNLWVSQYKNCWKWGHVIGVCKIQDVKYIKCNGLHQSIHHQQFAWCCKANKKTNSLRLKTKKGKPCLHLFKCSNYKGNHQANSNECSFWHHRFNRKWHSKKYVKIQENQKQLICSSVNSVEVWLLKT